MLIRRTAFLVAALLGQAGCLVPAEVVPPARSVDPETQLTLEVREVALSADIAADGFSSGSTVDLDVELHNQAARRTTVLPARARLVLHDATGDPGYAGEVVAAEQLEPFCPTCQFEQRVDQPAIPPMAIEPNAKLKVRLTFRAFPERRDGRPARATLQLPVENGPRLELVVADPTSPGAARLESRGGLLESGIVGLGARARWLGGPWGGPAVDPWWATLWLARGSLLFGPGWSLGLIAPDTTRAAGPSFSGSLALNAAWLPERLPVGAFLSSELLLARLQPPAAYTTASAAWLKLPSVTVGLLWTLGGGLRAQGPLPIEQARLALQRWSLLVAYTRLFNTGESWGSSALTVGFVVAP